MKISDGFSLYNMMKLDWKYSLLWEYIRKWRGIPFYWFCSTIKNSQLNFFLYRIYVSMLAFYYNSIVYIFKVHVFLKLLLLYAFTYSLNESIITFSKISLTVLIYSAYLCYAYLCQPSNRFSWNSYTFFLYDLYHLSDLFVWLYNKTPLFKL